MRIFWEKNGSPSPYLSSGGTGFQRSRDCKQGKYRGTRRAQLHSVATAISQLG